MNLVIYTVIFGKYDVLKKPKIINDKIKYVCITDKRKKCHPWEIRIVKPEYENLRRESRKYKILSHRFFKEYDYSIYLDGRFTITSDLSKYIEDWLGKNDLAVLKHPKRDCLYMEAKACIEGGLDDSLLIQEQIKRYRKEGYPEHNGLTAPGFIIRKHTKKIQKFNEMWWNEVKNFSFRDQISFCYVIFKYNLNYSIIPIATPFNRKNVEFVKLRYHGNKLTYMKYFLSSLRLNIKQRFFYFC